MRLCRATRVRESPCKYEHVCIESLGYVLPEEMVTSEQIEARLEPLYQPPAAAAGTAGADDRHSPAALLAARAPCPATSACKAASGRSCRLASTARRSAHWYTARSAATTWSRPRPAAYTIACNCRQTCLVYDVSNACLGLLNGMVQVANMIELGQIQAGLVVGTESARPLVENTIAALNADDVADARADEAGRGLADDRLGQRRGAASTSQRQLDRAIGCWPARALARTEAHQLCHSDHDTVGAGMQPLMQTDSRAVDASRGSRRARPRLPPFWKKPAGRATTSTKRFATRSARRIAS